jgi:hypothetical protein
MVLPMHNDTILLQSFTDDMGGVIWDGFGSFYAPTDTPLATAIEVFSDIFKLTPSADSLHEAASLNYFIRKSTGLVDLHITVYFADADDKLVITGQMTWFNQNEIPYKQMHPATGKWLPIVLKSSEPVDATIKVEQLGDHTTGKVTAFVVK